MSGGSVVMVLLLSATVAVPPSGGSKGTGGDSPRVVYECGLEEGKTAGLRLIDASLTGNAGEVISGEVSCRVASLEATGEWTPVLETTPDVLLPEGDTYWVRVRSRILDPGDYHARIVMDLYSPTSGHVIGGPSWTREEGALDTIDGLFPVDSGDDFRLRIRLYHRMAVVLDDITIRKTTGSSLGDGSTIINFPTGPDPDLLRLEGIRRQQKTGPLLRDMLVVTVNGGCGIRCWPWWDRIVEETRIDWANWQPLPRSGDDAAAIYGIRTTASGAEYQEYYSFESESPDIWPKRFETYFADGMNRSWENTFMQDEFFGEGGYFMCHNSPKWHDWIRRQLEDTLAHFEGICMDNIGCAPFDKPWGSRGCFCPWCEAKFRRHLGERYSRNELAEWGIPDLDAFSFRERFLVSGRFGEEVLEDPVAREWLKFQYRTHMNAWKDLAVRMKKIGAEQDRFVPVGGNQFGANGSWPFALLLSPWNDYVEIEDVHEPAPRGIVHRSLTYKMGLASGGHEKPVWVRGGPDSTRPVEWKVALAEALANGGIKTVDLAEAVYYIEPVEQERWPAADGRAVYEVYREYGEMVDGNRAAFARPKSEARVAVVFSFPSMMWNHFPPYRIDSGRAFDPPPFMSRDVLKAGANPFQLYEGTSSLLDENHIRHDFVIFAHPELQPDGGMVPDLNSYQAVVLPFAPCLSDAQSAALRQFTERGGRIVKIGDVGTRDENYNPREQRALDKFPSIDLLEDSGGSRRVLEETRALVTDASPMVRINRWRIMNGRGVAVHLVNYDNDAEHHIATPTLPISVDFPVGSLKVDTASMTTFGRETQSVPFRIEDGRIRCTIPSFEVYAVVVFAEQSEYDSANADARERREFNRESVRKERSRVRDLYRNGKPRGVRATVPGPLIEE